MSRRKAYIDNDVVSEATARIEHLADTFDELVVSFSGGKDSLCVLELTRQVLERRGRLPVHVNFYDEEVIPSVVIDLVDHYRRLPWVDLSWVAVPMQSHKFILGDTMQYTQWDPGRAHVRAKPPWAITETALGLPAGTVITQYDMEIFIGKRYPGRVGILNGIRASESSIRFRSCMSKLSENYINAGATAKTMFCKPIFDWEERDVFKFILEHGLKYTELYDAQALGGSNLRVATPLHAESARYVMHKWRSIDPDFYDAFIAVFPEMEVQERYHDQMRVDQVDTERYGTSYEGLELFIQEKISDPRQRALARSRLAEAIRDGKTTGDSDGFSPPYLLRQLQTGAYKRRIQRERWAAVEGRLDPGPKRRPDGVWAAPGWELRASSAPKGWAVFRGGRKVTFVKTLQQARGYWAEHHDARDRAEESTSA